jgi:hypothetical protein
MIANILGVQKMNLFGLFVVFIKRILVIFAYFI